MAVKIDRPIVQWRIDEPAPAGAAEVTQMHEKLERPARLEGATYKLKPPEHVSEHALYITLNDIVLNPGTEHELRRPFEVFVNSKSMEHFQWIVALTRVMSAVFRKGGDVTFLVEELRSVFDPRGGYWHEGRYIPSLVAALGDVIEQHLARIGLLRVPVAPGEDSGAAHADGEFPAHATLCHKCRMKAVVVLDSCRTCLNCGASKCE